ncbi:olfactory receptor 10S1-like isoform X2 [Malaclemys terrapin pileata]|uniref:olfactory receptor 10S1-like isoform X2 n=1 Tax=Malaclemys terrapin pileata TaxID=2991368 RepID=UPI0023A7F973|nr:olfactory receptor 10S1-like isoform X2 [Malaclemys terrapin pileata]
MEPGNQTPVTEFILEGFPNTRELSSLFFLLFLLLYLLTLLGNALTLLTVLCDARLHALPMYCFLGHLSFLDACLSSVTLPKILAGLAGPGGRTISFGGCVVQLYAFHFLASTECFLYTVMAYDRFLAICHPLRYSVVMSRRACVGLAAGTWLTGSLHATIHTTLTFRLPYCGPNRVEYFICDIPAMLKLACADTAANRAVILANIGTVAAGCFLLISVSYAYIASAILKIRTAQGRLRAFSTCSAHLSLVLLFYAPLLFVYVRSYLSHTSDGAVAMFYIMFTSLLNPFIYVLRNKEMKKALRRLAYGQALSLKLKLSKNPERDKR